MEVHSVFLWQAHSRCSDCSKKLQPPGPLRLCEKQKNLSQRREAAKIVSHGGTEKNGSLFRVSVASSFPLY